MVASNTYCNEKNLELPIIEMLSFILAEQDMTWKICQNLSTTPDKNEMPIILDHFHNGKLNLHRGKPYIE